MNIISIQRDDVKNSVTIDGSMGEGGGQVLRSSLALSLLTGRPFHIKNIRAERKKPGLLPQHLTAVNAASEISTAEIKGALPGSTELSFYPHEVCPGDYTFSVGTAGSTTLVLQTILPPLTIASGPSRLVIEGGTHNTHAPPFEFIEKCFLPCLRRMGPGFTCTLDRHGFYPAGGGRITVTVDPAKRLEPLEINERGKALHHSAHAIVSRLSPQIGRRELGVLKKMLQWDDQCFQLVETHNTQGPGNVLIAEMTFEHITEVFAGFGERGVPAEKVAKGVVREIKEYLQGNAPVGKYLADQLLLPLAMAGRGSFRTLPPTKHTLTNIAVIRTFLDIDIRCQEIIEKIWQIGLWP